ncbi:MAG: hypothetical protein FJW81_00740 [Actinobacteria bacterium]|nr:hypothetical protein [Actinomycetota bacterium]
MAAVRRVEFDHIGVITEEERPRETWVEATRVWVTNPRDHSHNVEFLRFRNDSEVTGPLRTAPHVAYRTTDLDASIAGHEVLLEPFVVGEGFARVAFVLVDGGVVEFMEYRDPDEEGWF